MFFILDLLMDNIVVCSVILATTALYLWLNHVYSYWAIRKTKYVNPIPFFGNSFRITFCVTPFYRVHQQFYNYFGDAPYGGIWDYWTPILIIKSPELLEHIMIKDFSTFIDRDVEVDMERDATSKNLVNLKGEEWRALRSKLTPVFSSGKLKAMIPLILDCSNVFVEYLEEKIASEKPLEVKDEVSGFATDVIASCAFGLSDDAVQDSNSTFKKIGKAVFAPSRAARLRDTLNRHFKVLSRLLGVRAQGLPQQLQNFFIKTVQDTVKSRKQKNVRREDFIQLMMDVRKKEETQIMEGSATEILMDDKTMASNALVFLLAGYETTASTLSYMFYELSINQDIQEKLCQEIVETLKKHNGEVNWDTLKEMNYLDQVISETLRKHPPVPAAGRKCVKPYKLPGSDMELPTGSVVFVPIHSLHHDPKYYPEPDKFNPNRFSEESRNKLVKCTFLPFGAGPRVCIGMRFALTEIKTLMVKLVPKYKFHLNPKTISPLQYTAQSPFLTPIGGIWIDFVHRPQL